MWRSGRLRYKPGVPRTGWRRLSETDFGEPESNCDWCGRPIRYVNVMTHPDWPDSVRVGRVCAIRMSRGRFRATARADQSLALPPSAGGLGKVRALLQREAPFRQEVWAVLFWLLVMVVAFLFFNPP
jgi:hypothetical protein